MSWDDAAATWDDDPAVRAYARGAHQSLLEVLAERGQTLCEAMVLDFGCGTGLLAAAIAPAAARVVALDVSPAMIGVLEAKIAARGLTNIEPVAADLAGFLAAEPPGAGRRFDLIVASSVCGFLPDYPQVVATLARCLRPQGIFVQWDWAHNDQDDEPYGLTAAEIHAALAGAGLERVHVGVGFEMQFEGRIMAPFRGVGQAR